MAESRRGDQPRSGSSKRSNAPRGGSGGGGKGGSRSSGGAGGKGRSGGSGRSSGSGGSGRYSSSGGSGRSGSSGGKGRSGGSGRSSGSGGSGRSGGTGRSGGAGRDDGRRRDEGVRGRGRSDDRGRGRQDDRKTDKKRRDLRGAAVDLPRWVVEDLTRTTPNHRIADALEALGEASAAFSEGKYQKALRHALQAKDLAPRDITVREVLALSAYRTGDWKQALRELRTYRRLSGELTHIPVEMDVLRALDRGDDVTTAWQLLQTHGSSPAVMKEGRVVYGSYLLDEGRIEEARALVAPGRMSDRPFEEDLRLWYVAARAAALDGDGDAARRYRNAILEHDPSSPGIDELERLIARLP